jgi:hypothetical protein
VEVFRRAGGTLPRQAKVRADSAYGVGALFSWFAQVKDDSAVRERLAIQRDDALDALDLVGRDGADMAFPFVEVGCRNQVRVSRDRR